MKTPTLYVVAFNGDVRTDPAGNLYTTQALSHAPGAPRDVLGRAVLTREEADTLVSENVRGDTVLEVEGMFPDDAIFEVQENTDKTEGRGSMRTVAYFNSFEAAFEVAKGRGVMGAGDGDILIHSMSSTFGPHVFSSKEEFEAVDTTVESWTDAMGSRVYSSYFGLSGEYFSITKNLTQEERKQQDPRYAQYLELKAIYG